MKKAVAKKTARKVRKTSKKRAVKKTTKKVGSVAPNWRSIRPQYSASDRKSHHLLAEEPRLYGILRAPSKAMPKPLEKSSKKELLEYIKLQDEIIAQEKEANEIDKQRTLERHANALLELKHSQLNQRLEHVRFTRDQFHEIALNLSKRGG